MDIMYKNDDPEKEKFVNACIYGDVNTVCQMILYKGIDPSFDNNISIKYAAWSGEADVVRTLMKDKRVNPADQDNTFICFAALFGKLDAVKELAKDPRVDLKLGVLSACGGASNYDDPEPCIEVLEWLISQDVNVCNPSESFSDRVNGILRTALNR